MRNAQMSALRARWLCAFGAGLLCATATYGQTITFDENPLTLSMGQGAVDVLIVDLLSEGGRDLVTADELDGTITVRLNSDGVFNSPIAIDPQAMVADVPLGMASGDIDANGSIDIVVANNRASSPGVSLLYNFSGPSCNTPSGLCLVSSFLASPGKVDVSSVALGDIDNDGDLDLAVGKKSTTQGLSSVTLHFNLGDGTFAQLFAQLSLANLDQVQDVQIRDLNNDGDGDVIAAVTNQFSGDAVKIWLSNGDETFQTISVYDSGSDNLFDSGSSDLAIADFDDDGAPDIAVANLFDSSIGVLLGNGDGTFAAADTYTVGVSPRGVSAIDLNGDGKVDLAAAIEFDDAVAILLGDGSGNFVLSDSCQPFSVGSNSPMAIDVADTDFDGRVDLVVAVPDGDAAVLLDQVIVGDIAIAGGVAGHDDEVDGLDLARLLAQWGDPCGAICDADLDCDDDVDGADLANMLSNWTSEQEAELPLMADGERAYNDVEIFENDPPQSQAAQSSLPWIIAALGFDSVQSYVEYVQNLTMSQLVSHITAVLEVILNENE